MMAGVQDTASTAPGGGCLGLLMATALFVLPRCPGRLLRTIRSSCCIGCVGCRKAHAHAHRAEALGGCTGCTVVFPQKVLQSFHEAARTEVTVLALRRSQPMLRQATRPLPNCSRGRHERLPCFNIRHANGPPLCTPCPAYTASMYYSRRGRANEATRPQPPAQRSAHQGLETGHAGALPRRDGGEMHSITRVM